MKLTPLKEILLRSFFQFRLKSIQELAGASTFEEKRSVCTRKLALCQISLKEVDLKIKNIDQDLEDLRTEKKDLKAYLQLERRKKALETVAKEKGQKEIKARLTKVEAEIEEKRKALYEARNPLMETAAQIQTKKEELSNLVELIRFSTESDASISKDLEVKYAEKERIKSMITDVGAQVKENEEKKAKESEEEMELSAKLSRTSEEFDDAHNRWVELSGFYQDLDLKLKLKQSDQNNIYARQERLNAFRTVQERNNWIQHEIQALEAKLGEKRIQEEDWTADLETMLAEKAAMEKYVADGNEKETEILAEIKQGKTLILNKTSTAKQFAHSREESAKECFKQREEIRYLEEQAENLWNKLQTNSGIRDYILGIKSVRIAYKHLVEAGDNPDVEEGFFGTVTNCLAWKKELNVCVNAILGRRAFVWVVSTAAVATKLLGVIKELKLPGSFDFLALDKVRSYDLMQYPPNMIDASPLINYIDPCEPRFEIVRRFYFNLWILVRNLESSDALRGSKFHCITVGGDQRNAKGIMMGGYYRSDRNSVQLYLEWGDKSQDIEEREIRVGETERTIEETGVQYAKFLDKIQKAKAMVERLTQKDLVRIRERLDECRQRIKNLTERSAASEAKLSDIRRDVAGLENDKTNLAKEINSDPDSDESMTQDCLELTKEITELLRNHKEAFKKKIDFERRKNQLENELKFLELKVKDLRKKDWTDQLDNLYVELETAQADYEFIEKQIMDNVKEREEHKKILDENLPKKGSITKALESLERDIERQEEERQAIVNGLERDLAKKRSLEDQANYGINYGEGTSASEEEIAKVAHLTGKQCAAEIKRLDRKVREKFGRVNKRAADQLSHLTELKERFQSQAQVCGQDSEMLQDLLETTTARCREKVHFTIRQVAKYFEEIFKVLVPNGFACLKLVEKRVKKSRPGSSSSSSVDSTANGDGPEMEVVGIAVHVRYKFQKHTSEHATSVKKILIIISGPFQP